MKKTYFLALTFTPLLGWAQSNNFTITAKVEHLTAPAKAYLKYDAGGKTVVDSALFNGHTFFFKGSIAVPVRAEILLNHMSMGINKLSGDNFDVLGLYLDNGQTTLTAKDSIKNAIISGSKINAENKQYIALLGKAESAILLLNAEFGSADENIRKDKIFLNDLQSRYDHIQQEKKASLYTFINENKDSYISLLALMEIAGSDMDVTRIEPVFKSLSSRLQQTPAGESFLTAIAVARRTSIGAVAPVFIQNDVNDKPVKLTDFRGKYVLLDFWASWCGPCRAENPNVVKAFKTYKDKNFTVLGVSLDQPGKKAAWLQAIDKDGLTWSQVSDLKAWDNAVAKLYGVQSIPQNYLIDPSGKIIAKNLGGEALDKKLASLLN